jgi:hypothetical protein
MSKHCIALVLLTLAGCYCLYSACYFFWLSATPLSNEDLRRAQVHYEFWIGALVIVLMFFAGIAIRMFHRRKRDGT